MGSYTTGSGVRWNNGQGRLKCMGGVSLRLKFQHVIVVYTPTKRCTYKLQQQDLLLSSLKVSPGTEWWQQLNYTGMQSSLTESWVPLVSHDPRFEVPQDRKSNGQNENKPEPKEMKRIAATLDNLAKLAFTSVPMAPWRALSGDYCSHRLCFLTQIRPTYIPFGDLSTISPVWGIIHGSIALHCTFWHSVVIPEPLLLDNCKLIVSANTLLFKNLFWLFYFICIESMTCFQKGRKTSRATFSLKAHL